MYKKPLYALLGLGLTVFMIGCKVDSATQKAESMDKGTVSPKMPTRRDADAAPSAATGPTGSVMGTVWFSGKAPTMQIDTTMDPACSMGGGSDKLPVEQIAVSGGKLANVFVYVKSGPPAAMQAGPLTSQAVVMDQQHCRYVPHVVGVRAGGTVEFRNSDLTMHNIHTLPAQGGNDAVDISQGPRGAPLSRQFKQPEMMLPVRCNNHPWMNAFINVSATPYFAVSDAAGHFAIAGLPPGSYVLGAVQEKLGEQDVPVTVSANGVTQAKFSYAPAK